MKWPPWLQPKSLRKPASEPSLTTCPKCSREMTLIEKFTMTGDDMRTYRCNHCREEHIVNFGAALWKIMSDANRAAE
jgi:transposase-like protein